ncbi:MAG: GNAT family N-acetyltransferase [Proteobacteria bacterium]|nr:GNAT family N-acetyltransferase [Pseudomonadota bacterium]MDA0861616.1 GNAT family N-acetyltransferase [Pseudomonadota bacterium]MDA1030719.1 GNAT family N-acetyltransferase [Pseudomonadota bacterium]
MLKLREQELRIPIGLSLTERDRENEESQHHFGIFNSDEQLCACSVLVVEKRNERYQLRQMVVKPSFRGVGIGRLLYEKVESRCLELGAHQIQLNARVSAKGFYGKLGFTEFGVEFDHITLPHIKMIKVL